MKDYFLRLPFYKDSVAFRLFFHILLVSDDNGVLETTHQTLANDIGVTRDQVRHAIERISNSGEIQIETSKSLSRIFVLSKNKFFHSMHYSKIIQK